MAGCRRHPNTTAPPLTRHRSGCRRHAIHALLPKNVALPKHSVNLSPDLMFSMSTLVLHITPWNGIKEENFKFSKDLRSTLSLVVSMDWFSIVFSNLFIFIYLFMYLNGHPLPLKMYINTKAWKCSHLVSLSRIVMNIYNSCSLSFHASFIAYTIQVSFLAPKQSHLTSRSTIVLPRDQNSSGMRLMFLKMAVNS